MYSSKIYTIYDNLSGGYTIRYKYYDRYEERFVVKVFQAIDVASMRAFTTKLKASGYKFVGKLD